METKQPIFKCIANLGDVNPFEHGGAFVLVDKTGVYSPELMLVDPIYWLPEEEQAKTGSHIRHAIVLEQCHRCPSKPDHLGSNKHHPDCPEWFGHPDKLSNVAEFAGLTVDELINLLTSDDPVQRAFGYMDLGSYYGHYEFDSYPQRLFADDAKELCDKMLKEAEEHDKLQYSK